MYAVKVSDTSKVYRLYGKPMDRLKEALIPGKCCHSDYYALKNVSFEVEQGQFLGIIGTNGSGKSTILKIITGVLSQTSGTVEVNGKISALLELGAGFNMEYTGIENVYMNGTMMGYSKEDMDKKIPEILEFADIGDYVYQPVRSYSSGMFVRLAFALAINVDPDILIVDEALAVGDVFFQTKCYQKINEIRDRGTTVILVTHSMGSIIKYCDKVVLLNKGTMVAEGDPAEMVDLYKKILTNSYQEEEEDTVKGTTIAEMDAKGKVWKDSLVNNPDYIQYGDGKAQIIDYAITDDKKNITNTIVKNTYFTIRMKVQFMEPVKNPIFAFTIKDKQGTEITGTNTMVEKQDVEDAVSGDIYEIEFTQKAVLHGGEYLLSLGCTGFEEGEFCVHERLYDVTMIGILSDKDIVGMFDMNAKVSVEKTK